MGKHVLHLSLVEEEKKGYSFLEFLFYWSIFDSQCCINFYFLAKWFIHLFHTYILFNILQLGSVQSLSHVRFFATPWTAACQVSLSITNSRSSLKLMSIESVMPSTDLILCRPLLLLPPIPPSIRVFSNESSQHEVAKVLEFQPQHQSFTPRTDDLL